MSLFGKLFNVNNFLFWFSICLISNSVFFYYNLENSNKTPKGKLFSITGDAIHYVYPAENVCNGKDYSFFTDENTKVKEGAGYSNVIADNANIQDIDKGMCYAFRTPGFAFIFIPLRLFFSFNTTLLIILLLQVLLSAYTKYLLAKLGYKLVDKEIAFYLLIIALNISSYTVSLNNLFFTESFALSFLIISIYLFFRFLTVKDTKTLLFSGLFFMEVIFLRPFMAPFYVLFVLLIFYNTQPFFRKSCFYILLFSIPLIITDGAWSIRNYVKTEKFIPLASTLGGAKFANKSAVEQWKLTQSFGKTCEWWDDYNNPIKWFMDSSHTKKPNELFPNYIFGARYNTDSIIEAKKLYLLSENHTIPKHDRLSYEIHSATIIRNIREDYKSTYPFKYYVLSRLKLLKEFINQPIDHPLITAKYPLNVINVFSEGFVDYFVFFWGSISLFWGLFHFRRNINMYILISIPLFIFLLFPIILQSQESRELYLAFPFLLLIGVLSLTEVTMKPILKKLFWSALSIVLLIGALFHTLECIHF